METSELVPSRASDAQHTNTNSNGTNSGNSNASSSSSVAEEGSELMVAKVGYLVALSVVIVLGNILVIVSVVKMKAMHRVTNYLLVSLAAADLMVGALTIPLFILWLLKHHAFVQAGLCNVILLICLFVMLASQLNVILVTVERYGAICHPFLHHRLLVSKPELVPRAISLVWISSVVCTGLSSLAMDQSRDRSPCSYHSHFHRPFLLATVVLGVFAPFAAISALNLRMLVKVRSSRLYGQETHRPATAHRIGTLVRLSKASTMVITVCSLYLLAWTPFFVVVVIHSFCSTCRLRQALDLILFFTFTNSAWNPLVYALCNLMFRRAYKQILTGCCFPSSGDVPVLARKDSVFFPLRSHLPTVAVND